MLIKKFKHKVVSGFISCMLVLTATAANAEKTLTAAVPVPVDTVWGNAFKRYAEIVSEKSEGELRIRVVGPESIPAQEQMQALRIGMIDILSTFPGAYRSEFPEANVQEISNVSVDDQRKNGAYAKLKKVFDNRFDAELLATYAEGLGFHIFLSNEIKDINDLKGLRIRTAVLQQPLLKALKTQPINIPIPEVFTALERNMVDGYSWSSLGLSDMGWDTMTKYRVDPKFYNIIFNVFLSNKAKEKFTNDDLKLLREAAVEFEEKINVELLEAERKEYANQESLGIKSIDLGSELPVLARKVYWDELTRNSKFASELKLLMDIQQ